MALSSRQYWLEREKRHFLEQAMSQQELLEAVRKNHRESVKRISGLIDAEWANYAGRNGYTMEEAQQRVSEMDVKAFAEKAAEYVKTKDFSEEANERLRAYNLKMRVSRLEMLKRNIHLELLAEGSGEQNLLERWLMRTSLKILTEDAGILGETVFRPEKLAKDIVQGSFHSATFSQRIWANVDELRNALDTELSRAVINGEHSRDVAKRLAKKFDVARNNAERLAITETARISADTQKESFTENGFEKYEYRAEPTACDICKALDGKEFHIRDMKIGVNMYPMHPWCHCYITPVYDGQT